jgi:hypothetical protein
MAGMGPPPKDASKRARRNASISMTQLPAAGRQGAAPEWPLLDDVAATARLRFLEEQSVRLRDEWAAETDTRKARGLGKRLESAEVQVAEARQLVVQQRALEMRLWADLWATPQAVAWERLRWTREVAQYVRWKVKAELGSLDASKEARQLADRLGLSPLSMLRLRWAVAEDEVGAQRDRNAAASNGSRARRGPLRSVDPPKAAGDD